MTHFAKVVKKELGKDIDSLPGAGAAGGLGAGLVGFLDAELQRGGDLLVEILELEDAIRDADIVITGEGGINHQTVFGKTPIAVSRVAQKYGVPTLAMAGSLSEGYEAIYDEGITAAFSTLPEITSLEVALENGYENLKNTSMNIARTIKLAREIK